LLASATLSFDLVSDGDWSITTSFERATILGAYINMSVRPNPATGVPGDVAAYIHLTHEDAVSPAASSVAALKKDLQSQVRNHEAQLTPLRHLALRLDPD